MTIRIFALRLAVLLAALLGCAHADKWVSPSGAGTCASSASPCTWATANSQHTAGTSETVHFASGTYSGGIDITKGGASGANVYKLLCDAGAANYQAAIGKCVFTGTVAFANISFFVEAGVSNIIIQGFDIGNNAGMGSGIGVSGGTPASSHIYAIGNYVHDLGQSVFNSAGTVGPGCPEAGAITGGNAAGSTDMQAIGNFVKNFGVVPRLSGCSVSQGIYWAGTNEVYENNLVVKVPTGGIQVQSSTNAIVSNNTIINTANCIILEAVSGTPGHNTVANNYCGAYGNMILFASPLGTQKCQTTAPNLFSHNIRDGSGATFSAGPFSCDTVSDGPTPVQAGASFFTNYQIDGSGDYHLKTGSAGIGGGSSATTCTSGGISPCGPSTDIVGVTRPSPPSVGAFDVAGGGGAPIATVTPNPPTFASVMVGATGPSQLLTLTNAGTANMTVSASFTITPSQTDFIIAGGGSCFVGQVLAPGQGCTAGVAFKPSAAGTRTAKYNFFSTAAGSPLQVNLSGVGTVPDASLTSLNGGVPLSITNIDDAGDWGTLSCPEPSPLPNPIDGSWSVKHDTGTSGTSCGNTSLSGSPSQDGQSRRFDISWTALGGERASIFFNPAFLDSKSRTYVIDTYAYFSDLTHVNDIEIDMNQVMANGQTVIFGIQANFLAGFWQYTTASSPTTSQWNSSTIAVSRASFNTGATPNHIILTSHRDINGILTYDSVNLNGVSTNFTSAVGNSSFTLNWTPIGENVLNFQIDGDNSANSMSAYLDKTTVFSSGASLGFGSQALNTTSPALTASLLNSGTGPLTPTGFSATPPFAISANGCPVSPATLAPGNSCQISVTYTPTTATTSNGTLTVTSDAVSGSQSIFLAGSGQPAPIPGTTVIINGPILLNGAVQFNPQ